ncbi:MAG: preprotein translocase subunit SecG [Pirellulaceae bacterium]|nr:preprotein translocase subunit SecG [Pirellulaceae bacterium]
MLLGLLSHYFFGISIFLTSLFLILLVLVQRGRGGGIAGALGGAGGQSAFGTKAGDLFTRITVGAATVWIVLCCAAIFFLKGQAFTTGVKETSAAAGSLSGIGEAASVQPAAPSINQPADSPAAAQTPTDATAATDQNADDDTTTSGQTTESEPAAAVEGATSPAAQAAPAAATEGNE